jgi:hypothetical protein
MQLYSPERQDLTSLGLTVETGDESPTIPPQLFAGITIPFPLKNFTGGFGANPTIRRTAIIFANTNVGASATAQSINVVTLGTGLWRLNLHLAVDADFNTPSPILAANACSITLQSPGGINNTLTLRWPNTLVNQSSDFILEVLLVDEGWIITNGIPATAAAQTLSSSVTVQAVRLL